MPTDNSSPAPTSATLTTEERDQMAHAVGHATAKGCSVSGGRNYYSTSPDDPVWLGLVGRGFAVARPHDPGQNQRVFHVTDDGRAAVDSDPRTVGARLARGRRYAIKFRGSEDEPPTYAWGTTRGKAKAAAARRVWDCFPDGDAFLRIASCTLADAGAGS